jgi:hypothetical protein
MNKIIKTDIYFDGTYYCGRCLDFDVFTQGKTLDVDSKGTVIHFNFFDYGFTI